MGAWISVSSSVRHIWERYSRIESGNSWMKSIWNHAWLLRNTPEILGGPVLKLPILFLCLPSSPAMLLMGHRQCTSGAPNQLQVSWLTRKIHRTQKNHHIHDYSERIQIKISTGKTYMGQSREEIRHKLPVIFSQQGHMMHLILPATSKKCWQAGITQALVSMVFISGQSHRHGVDLSNCNSSS